MTPTSQRTEALATAFEAFNEHSQMLEQSYRELQQTVVALSTRLEKAQAARLSELAGKRKLSRHLSDLLDSLPGAIVVLDGNGVIRENNSEATKLLNRPLAGCSWSQIVNREVRDGGSQDGNIQLRDGRWLTLSRRSLRQGNGEILLLADVTESRRMTELRQRRERLTTIGEMTAKFAHQVRTPLASAMLYTARLDTSSPAQQKYVQKLTARLNDLGRMVNDMLGFAAGAKPSEESFNVGDLLSEIRRGWPVRDGFKLRTITGDSNIRVRANRDALKGAVCNLINNAVQACGDDARVVLECRRCAGRVLISVRDNGPGISAENFPNIFEPFFTTRPQGTGLGLAVVRAVAQAHGGSVDVESTADGATFTISLPQSDYEVNGDG